MSLSGIQLSSSVITGAGKPVDAKYGPYPATADAIQDVTVGLRYIGLTVGIIDQGSPSDGVIEYWWKENTTDGGLVIKTTEASDADLFVESNDIDIIDQVSQAEYDAISNPNSRTLYIIS